MSEMDVAACLSNFSPSVCLEPFDNFSALHSISPPFMCIEYTLLAEMSSDLTVIAA